MPLPPLLLALLSPASHAFCGTYVGPAGAALTNRTSPMVVVREGERTTVTMAGDAAGAAASFGMLVPVPAGVEGARLLDDLDLLDRVDRYAGPRLVSYTCDDLERQGVGAAACGAVTDRVRAAAARAALGTVRGALGSLPLAQGESTLEVLGPDAVDGWAAERGWSLDPAAAALLDASLTDASRLLAVSMDLDQGLAGGQWLRPLQFSYTSDDLSLPIELGALHSPGVQDVVVHVITGPGQGAVGIANQPEFTVESECLVREAGGWGAGLEDFYADAVDQAFEAAGGEAAWTTEYTWAPAKCDPCPDEGPLDDDVLRDLGYEGDPTQATLTRLRARFRPDAAQGGLALYESGLTGTQQRRYIQHLPELESSFPLCGDGWAPDPGECPVDSGAPEPAGLPALPGAALVALLGWARRRRPDAG